MTRPQAWLDEALRHSFCWHHEDEEEAVSHQHPPYIYWYDAATEQFYVGQRLQRRWVGAEQISYKGYPAEDAEVPKIIVDRFHEQGLLDDAAHSRLRRARRQRHGAKP